MERKSAKYKKLPYTRVISYLLIGLSGICLVAATAIGINYFRALQRKKYLEKVEKDLIREIAELENQYAKRLDDDYYTLYVTEYYYKDGKIVYK